MREKWRGRVRGGKGAREREREWRQSQRMVERGGEGETEGGRQRETEKGCDREGERDRERERAKKRGQNTRDGQIKYR